MKTKMSKKTTVTVTILACLLAVAVATTIVLAAFSANKTATTTVKFSNGVQVRIDGAYKTTNTAGDADPISRTSPVTLLWACTEDDGTQNATQNTTQALLENVSNKITFQAINFVNGNASESDVAWFIARAVITGPSGAALSAAHSAAVSITRASTWTQIGSTDWYAYTNGSSASTDVTISSTALDMADVALSASIPFVTAAKIEAADINDLAGAQFEATVEIYAINAGAADAQTVLSGIVSGS